MFFGLLQHRAMPNRSKSARTGLILQYLPKYVRPMEDLRASVDEEVLAAASPQLRKMLLMDYPYPAVLDRAKQRPGERPKYDI
jgi:ectoine hydroxylase-related dioxygenase (phytanoyl-CoA dioxygenase family)